MSSTSNSINLIYIRAAIEAKTGQTLPLEQIRKMLVEEGLITPSQARHHAKIFRGYHEYYDTCSREDATDDGFEQQEEYEVVRSWEESGPEPL